MTRRNAWFPVLLLGTLLVLLGPVLVACGGGGEGPPPDPPPIEPPEPPPPEPPPPEPPPPEPPPVWPPLDPLAATRLATEGRFATAPLCQTCHSNATSAAAMRDSANRPIAPMDLWRASVMAAAARDPYWRAAVSREVLMNPTLKSVIENECITCHSPMAHYEAEDEGGTMSMDFLDLDTDRAQIALDGVSCTFCHQIVADGLGSDENFSGNFAVNDDSEIYAGHTNPNAMPMFRASGYSPVVKTHLRGSDACASCHTLFTHSFDAAGDPTGDVLTEQSPYLEWLNSVFNNTVAVPHDDAATCQDCHASQLSEDGVAIETKIARTPSGTDYGRGAAPVRDEYNRHVFSGGNAYLAEWLRDNADELQPNASGAALDAVAAAARALLSQQTADLTVRNPSRDGDSLAFEVRVANQAGHKFPTSYPSRRAWLRVLVKNGAGTVVFSSGEHDAVGRLVDADGQVLSSEEAGGPYQPHYDEVTLPTQVQIYQPVMVDSDGVLTFGLLRAASYVKDNRLLPRGWDPNHTEATRTDPSGNALTDDDFVGGRDDVRYRVTAPAAAGPYTVEVDLFYQPISPRHAAELFTVDTQEIANFRRFYEAGNRTPEHVASVQQALP